MFCLQIELFYKNEQMLRNEAKRTSGTSLPSTVSEVAKTLFQQSAIGMMVYCPLGCEKLIEHDPDLRTCGKDRTMKCQKLMWCQNPPDAATLGQKVAMPHFFRGHITDQMFARTFDPDNRLVADALEADWNAKLRALAAAQEAYEKAAAADVGAVNDAERAQLMTLATDFPRLWRDPRTQMKDKKRMLRLLIEDVTLTKGYTVHMDIRFVGGATRSLDLPLPKSCVVLRTTDAAVVEEINTLIDTYTDKEIADLLNERGVRTVVTTPWTAARIGRLRHIYHLKDRRTRLLAQGLLAPEDLAARYGVLVSTVHMWRRRGLLRAHPTNDRGDFLYEIPPEDLPAKFAHKRDYQVDPATSSSHN